MPNSLTFDKLYRFCDPDMFTFNTTNDLPDVKETRPGEGFTRPRLWLEP